MTETLVIAALFVLARQFCSAHPSSKLPGG